MSLRRKLEQLARARTEPPAARSDDERRRAWYAAHPVTPEQGAQARAELERLMGGLCARVEAGEEYAAEQYALLLADLEARAAEHEA